MSRPPAATTRPPGQPASAVPRRAWPRTGRRPSQRGAWAWRGAAGPRGPRPRPSPQTPCGRRLRDRPEITRRRADARN
eukprot:5284224-Pyramimonas_sp.AAC.1